MTRVLGFDPGLANTGWGVIDADAGRLKPIAYGSITTAAGTPGGERLSIIYDGAVELIRKYSPEIAGIESIYFARNVKSAIPVAEAKGVLLLALQKNGVRSFEYTPIQIKQAITGAGRAEKHQVQELLRILLGLSDIPRPDHAADALGAAVCCFNTNLNMTRGLNRV